jgi:hypothetical protein
MKEFVLVEFLFDLDEYPIELGKLIALGKDFKLIKCDDEFDDDSDGLRFDYKRVSGKIDTMTASVIKLQNPALAGKMRISYISDELKNKYRT